MFGSTEAIQQNQFARLTFQQQQYLQNVAKRKEAIQQLVVDHSTSLVHFTYELDPANAVSRTQALEQECVRLAQQNTDSSDLLSKLQKAKERNPNTQVCAIVPIKGIQGLTDRMKNATTAHEKIQLAYNQMGNDNQFLKANTAKFQAQLQSIQVRHVCLSHQFLRVVNLLEEAAALSNNYENNHHCQSTNMQILAEIEDKYNWGQWQSRVNILKYHVQAMSQEGRKTQTDTPMDEPREKAIFNILSEASMAIDHQIDVLRKSEKKVQLIEERLKGSTTTRKRI